MPALCSCLRLSPVVLVGIVLLGFSPVHCQTSAGGEMIGALLPEVVNLSVTRYQRTNADAGNIAGQPLITREKTQASGFIIDPSGIIVTNRHAVSGAADIIVTLDDGTRLSGTALAEAPQSDIALLKVDAARQLPSAGFGNSDELLPGDPVYVIGNPFGFGSTVTSGIVSALDRDTPESGAGSFIQIDAALNRGNSGGPVFDLHGKVVGISTALYSPAPETGFVGIGYAIPINDARFIIDQLRTKGQAKLGWIGIHVQPVSADIAAAVGLVTPTGSIVLDVGNGTPAAHAGLSPGDIILKVDNKDAPKPLVLNRDIDESRIGSAVNLLVWRGGATQVLPVTLAESPADTEGAKSSEAEVQQEQRIVHDDLGLVVGPVTEEIRHTLGLAGTPDIGVAIRRVVAHSVAADRALAPGSLILNIDRQQVTSSSDLQRGIEAARRDRRGFILLLLRDQSGLHWVSLPLPS
jgi:serine protease Do